MTQKKNYLILNDDISNIILYNIKTLRKLKKISSKEMALELKIKPYEYSKIESGKIKLLTNHVDEISRILNIDKFQLSFSEKDLFNCSHFNQQIVDIINKQMVYYADINKMIAEREETCNKKINKLNDELQLKNAQLSELQVKYNALNILYKLATNPVNTETERERERVNSLVNNFIALYYIKFTKIFQ